MTGKEKIANKLLGNYSEEAKKATEEFMTSIINGEAFSFPVEVVKDSEQDKMLRSHPMFDKAIKVEHKKFKDENSDTN
ncbi:MAG: hypothetical protein KDD03_13370 [Gelidibacter sp.]|nr:hypothetical protein [Gelidibacter sp.]